jgi:N6-adenosine-specific RNA methylase IME4/ParB-like chromosome segregation protein Spo0J
MQIHPVAELFPRMGEAEFNDLVNDIAKHGQREPVWTYQGALIDGRHRWQACERLRISCASREYEGGDVTAFVVSLNLKRRHLSDSQRAMVAASLANLNEGRPPETAQICAVSQASAAEMLNVSRRAVQHAVKVRDDATPELVEAVTAGRVSVSAAADVAELPKHEQREIVARGESEILKAAKEIRAKKAEDVRLKNEELRRAAVAVPPPPGLYRTIVIDPPWPMEIVDRDVRPAQVGMHYPTMSIDEIKRFSLPAGDDAIVYLWTTQRFLPAAFDVLEAWEFKYLVTMVWHKPGGPQPFNLPQYNCEFVLIGRRGNVPFMDTKQFFTCFTALRREHSRKPDEFYELVRRVSPGPRIDMFSREPRDGFDQFGNETGKFGEAA